MQRSSTYSGCPSGSLIASKDHVTFCFDVLAAHFNGAAAPDPFFENVYCPLFVTWNKQSRRGSRLRGCIGTLEPRQLHTALKDYALTSALRDRRFEPVAHRELAALSCTVSLLYGFETVPSWHDWTIGTHGLIIDFFDPLARCQRSATFLPEIARHERWSQRETMEALVAKSGYSGAVTSDLLASLTLTRYQSSAWSLTYDEYCAARQPAASLVPPAGGRAITVPA